MEYFYNIEKLIRVNANDSREVDNDFKFVPEWKPFWGKVVPAHIKRDHYGDVERIGLGEIDKYLFNNCTTLWYDHDDKVVRRKYFIELMFAENYRSVRYYDTQEDFDKAVAQVEQTLTLSGITTITLDDHA